jgi:anti-sigma regulatory factor (Ser/Thr protein kinase)
MSTESLKVPASLDSLGLIRQYIAAAAAQAGLPHRSTYRLQLAADEIATNVVTHGGGDTQPDAHIIVSSVLDDAVLTIILADNTHPFDPTQQELHADLNAPLAERPIGGMGVYLALQNVDQFTYEYVDPYNYNMLTMHRSTDTASGQ